MCKHLRSIVSGLIRIVILLGLMGYAGILGVHRTSAASVYCAGATNTSRPGSLISTSAPATVKSGETIQIGITVYNPTIDCVPFWAFIEIGGGNWNFPNATGPKVTSHTDFQWSGPGQNYYSYRMVWSGWIATNSHVNFYEPMRAGTSLGSSRILSVVLHTGIQDTDFTGGSELYVTVQ